MVLDADPWLYDSHITLKNYGRFWHFYLHTLKTLKLHFDFQSSFDSYYLHICILLIDWTSRGLAFLKSLCNPKWWRISFLPDTWSQELSEWQRNCW